MFQTNKVFRESFLYDPDEAENPKSSPSSRDDDWDDDEWEDDDDD